MGGAPDRSRGEAQVADPSVTPGLDARPRVLVVEDDRDLHEVLCDVLALDGYAPVPARDGREALAVLRSGAALPALVLLDLVMPGMNGWQFRAEQLRDPALASLAVVAMSASDELAGVRMLKKPFDVDDVAQLLGRHSRSAKIANVTDHAPTTSIA